jgi:methionine synthase II (cobalamin-independent)
MLHFWGGRAVIDEGVYPDLEEFWSDAVDAWVKEIEELHAAGCNYVQMDDVTFPLLCDPRGRRRYASAATIRMRSCACTPTRSMGSWRARQGRFARAQIGSV